MNRVWRWAALLAVSLLLTVALDGAGLPAALLLGPLLAALGLSLAGTPLRLPRGSFTAAQAAIGLLLAQALTPQILLSFAADWVVMLLIVASTVIAGGVVGWVMVKAGSLPGKTAAWGSAPGAASAMVALAGEFGADMQLVAFMQYLRVLVVVFSASLVSRLLLGAAPTASAAPAQTLLASAPLPFAATLAVAGLGVALGRALRIPGGALLAPMLIGMVLHSGGILEISLPPWLLGLAYVVLGWSVGMGFNRQVFAHALRALPQMLLAILLLMLLCGISAWLLTLVLHIDPLTAYLATSPGGLDAIAIIAVSSHADIPFVMAIQTLRLFAVLLTGAPIARLICRYA